MKWIPHLLDQRDRAFQQTRMRTHYKTLQTSRVEVQDITGSHITDIHNKVIPLMDILNKVPNHGSTIIKEITWNIIINIIQVGDILTTIITMLRILLTTHHRTRIINNNKFNILNIINILMDIIICIPINPITDPQEEAVAGQIIVLPALMQDQMILVGIR